MLWNVFLLAVAVVVVQETRGQHKRLAGMAVVVGHGSDRYLPHQRLVVLAHR